MNSVKINKLAFSCLNIQDNLWLLQAADTKKKSLPLLAEKLHSKFEGTIENIVASESEILIYGTEEFQLDKLNNEELGWSILKEEAYEIQLNLEKGLDWDLVTKHCGKTKEEFKRMLLKNKFTVCMYGFRPGFLYMNGLTQAFQISRREKPRQTVAAGSLAIGGKYIGIYGTEAPAGWNIIGMTDFVFKPEQSAKDLPSINQQIKFRINA